MMQKIAQYGREHGFVALTAMTSSRLLASIYEKHGFLKGDTDMDIYITINGDG